MNNWIRLGILGSIAAMLLQSLAAEGMPPIQDCSVAYLEKINLTHRSLYVEAVFVQTRDVFRARVHLEDEENSIKYLLFLRFAQKKEPVVKLYFDEDSSLFGDNKILIHNGERRISAVVEVVYEAGAGHF